MERHVWMPSRIRYVSLETICANLPPNLMFERECYQHIPTIKPAWHISCNKRRRPVAE